MGRKMRCRVYSVIHLAELLKKYRWSNFLHNGTIHTRDVTFVCRIGFYMNRPALAVMAQGKFVVIRFIQLRAGSYGHSLLYPYTYSFDQRTLVGKPNLQFNLDPICPKKCGVNPTKLAAYHTGRSMWAGNILNVELTSKVITGQLDETSETAA